ncbi:hypothetical protein [Thalassotalea mangrovi]|uniref:Uncharacterized protein n=1 Tax=Thalassotalea mangrovi TaxID=2572245 RepID=A0A4U1B7T4_9GAMM|nr:hypothetical protein [Thalassotalea mangrovi]TKB45971.1 hypothetical protein E8M12_06935 [Thalassotalea mangrovi]
MELCNTIKYLLVSFCLMISWPSMGSGHAPVDWKELVNNSELIAIISLDSISKTPDGLLSTVTVIKPLKGNTASEHISILWKPSTASLTLNDFFKDYVVFINKRDDGTYSPSIISKSFWVIESDKRYVDLELNLSFIENIPNQLYEMRFEPGRHAYVDGYEIRRVFIDSLISYFEDQEHLKL